MGAAELLVRARRLSGYGPRLVLRLVAHRARLAVASAAFTARLRSGAGGRRFLAGPTRLALRFDAPTPALRDALGRLEELVLEGAHPLSSDDWLDLDEGAVFSPLGTSPAAGPPRRRLRGAPLAGLEDALACAPYRGDRKIPQDLARLGALWILVAADAQRPPSSDPRARQAAFLAYVEAFFAGASSREHAFWSCPMDAGIGATTLLLASEHFVGLDRGSPEAAALRALRDRLCSQALALVTLLDERTPVLNNNHHLLNRISAAILAGLSDDRAAFERSLAALVGEVGEHFDDEGVLAEGSSWYHAFVHHALRLAADLLAAFHPAHAGVAALGARVARLRDLSALLSAGDELLLVGDADGAVYGPNVAVSVVAGPIGAARLRLVRRHPAPAGREGTYARREGDEVVVLGRALACDAAPGRSPCTDGSVPVALRRRGDLTLLTTRATAAASADRLELEHLAGFGVLVVSCGTVKVVVRTVPRTDARPLGHFHLDVGSVFVAQGGRWRVADPGVVTYTGDPGLRARLRGAAAHPTLIPDARQPIRPTGPFSAAPGAPLAEELVRSNRRVEVRHRAGTDAYHASVRLSRGGRITVRQWTRAPLQNVPAATESAVSYGYLIR